MIKALLKAGADISPKDYSGLMSLHWVAKNRHVDAIKALKEAGADVSALDNDG